jgi:hypothetical protein
VTTALVGSLFVMLSAFMATGFIIDYHRFSHGGWRRDPFGRHLMAYVSVDAVVLILGTIRFLGGASLDTGWFAWMRIIVFLGVPWTIGWRWLILRRLYKRQTDTTEMPEPSNLEAP